MARVLIVEDNDPLREMLRDVLSARGLDVFVAATAAEALELCACYSVDVILSDLDLPHMSGLELCRAVRKQTAAFGGTVPIWLMTGSDEVAVVKQARAAGALGVLRKPFSLSAACACVERSINAERHAEVTVGAAGL